MPVITAENLGKKYLIGHQSERESYTALRDVIARSAKQWVSKTRQLLRGEQLLEGDTREEFWALQDLNFEIEAGDRVGIIGRNGAGKSTLLKILSRITEPTTGRVVINGRVASLLEVGTGFHPELSGRENIYLNGAILGMSRAEIRRKFDEIVAFAGVEKFIDTPVKRYSSGMYVRLAFSVAAHLEPEILVVDEVLAVGDAEFQKKCLGKMEDVSKNEGRTVLFVSHNMPAIQSLCSSVIHLQSGAIAFQGGVSEGVANYLSDTYKGVNSTELPIAYVGDLPREKGIGKIIKEVWIENSEGKITNQLKMGESFTVKMKFEAESPIKKPLFGFIFENNVGVRVATYSSIFANGTVYEELKKGLVALRVISPNLNVGKFLLSFVITKQPGIWIDFVEHALGFDTLNLDMSDTVTNFSNRHGVIFLKNEIIYINCI
jgi:lipopolysaccharide transport system ATP-binding protein